MLGLTFIVLNRLRFLTSVALHTTLEIVILTVAADPATVWEVKRLFVDGVTLK